MQNALEGTPTHTTEMYDGSHATNLHDKIRQELIALKSRNVTPGGALQAIKTVIYRQILYPMTYANTDQVDMEKMQKLVNTVLRNKFRMPSHLNTNTLYMHEDAGGLGQDEIIDLINVDRLILLVNCMNQTGEMKTIMTGAIERMQDYAGISTCPLSTNITNHTQKPRGMWLYQLKEWMEKNHIEAKTTTRIQGEKCIMDMCTRKTEQKAIWEWTKKEGVKYLKDLVYLDGSLRENILSKTKERSSIIAQTREWITSNKQLTQPKSGGLSVGRWIKHVSGTVGKIIEDIGTHTCRSSMYTNSKKGYVPTGRITRCEKQHFVERKPRVELETPTENTTHDE